MHVSIKIYYANKLTCKIYYYLLFINYSEIITQHLITNLIKIATALSIMK